MKIIHIVGARPNFMKAVPVLSAIAERDFAEQVLVHTGQHYDAKMSDIIFKQLGLPQPDVNLGVGSGSHAWQTAQVMTKFEPVVLEHRPDLILVYGDVNSTIAAALVAAKLGVRVGHVEAGLRSGDRTMPEEINRVLTDHLADLLLTPSRDGDENLLREGVPPDKIFRVGNVMIDTLIRLLPAARELRSGLLEYLGLGGMRYGLVTLHRPSNVDESGILAELLEALSEISRQLPLIFPVHPRTRERIASLPPAFLSPSLHLVDPLSYLEFLALQDKATLVITDSGGIQEETTFLGVPCLTVRENTERPVTTRTGTNTLVGRDPKRLRIEAGKIIEGRGKKGSSPPLWDGKAGERIADVIVGCCNRFNVQD